MKAQGKATPPPPQRSAFDIVRMAALAGIGMLDKYYSKTDDSIMYRVAMRTFSFICMGTLITVPDHCSVMHPSYGLSYFEEMEWPKDWKDNAVALARAQWVDNYRVEVVETTAEPEVLVLTISFTWMPGC